MTYAVIFAGGVGKRMNQDIPKQFLTVNDKPIIIYTIEHFDSCRFIDNIVVVCVKEYIEYCKELIKKFNLKKIVDVIPGGSTSQESTFNGLDYLINKFSIDKNDIVLIHDGVRPLIDEQLIIDNINCVKKNNNCITVAKAIETIVRIDEDNQMIDVINRDYCRYARAPQSFYLNDIYNIHLKSIKDNVQNKAIDSASLMSMYNIKLYTTECDQKNIKITTLNDYYMFKGMIENNQD